MLEAKYVRGREEGSGTKKHTKGQADGLSGRGARISRGLRAC